MKNAVVEQEWTDPDPSLAFKPETYQLRNLEVNDKQYSSYYKQIKHNMSVGIKAIYLVCRDLYDAKLNLGEDRYLSLAEQLGISRTTLIKYECIGKSNPLKYLFNVGALPNSWTTQYYLTSLSEDQLKNIKGKIGQDTTKAEIMNALGIKDNREANDFYNLFEIDVEKTLSYKHIQTVAKEIESFLKKQEWVDGLKLTINKKVLERVARKETAERKKQLGKSSQKGKKKKIVGGCPSSKGTLDAFVTVANSHPDDYKKLNELKSVPPKERYNVEAFKNDKVRGG